MNVIGLAQVPPPPLPLKVAVTDRDAVMDTVQFPVPVHAPLHPANVDPLAATAVSVTDVPLVKLAAQALPQLMPAGDDVTVPLPVPTLLTVSAFVPGVVLSRTCANAGNQRLAIFTNPEVTGCTPS